jgi:lipid-A-disaccharide synthase-like uncharacterized protein
MLIPEELRIALYPLGLISTLAFTLRFLVQWIQSEKAHRSTVSSAFWWISLIGNLSLLTHSLIQGQYFICVVQGFNGVIAVRNLNLMQPQTSQWALSTVLFQFAVSLIAITGLFWTFSSEAWFRTPIHAFQTAVVSPSFGWSVIGFLGVVLFASRFWVQWVHAERCHASSLERPFWWLSLVGATFSLLYFALIQDYINLVGPLFGLIPYCRNLILMRRSHAV